jgi:hypothetical protein
MATPSRKPAAVKYQIYGMRVPVLFELKNEVAAEQRQLLNQLPRLVTAKLLAISEEYAKRLNALEEV